MKKIDTKTYTEDKEMKKKLKKVSTLKEFAKKIDHVLKMKYLSNGKPKKIIPQSPKLI
jgi:hypothetical protein